MTRSPDDGEVVTLNHYRHEIDSPAYIGCPNEDCGVGTVSLDRNLDEDGVIECEYCGTRFQLQVKLL